MSTPRPVNGDTGLHHLPTEGMRSASSSSPQASGLADNQSLLCGESMLKASPPGDQSAKVDSILWKSIDSDNNNLPPVGKHVNSAPPSDEGKRMNSGGHDRMTGPGTTTSNDSWLIQVTSQQARGHSLRSEHDVQHAMLPLPASAGVQSGVFRPPLTVGERPHLLYSGQYPQYTTGSSLQRYSPTLYSQQGTLSSLHPPYYYPASYSAPYQGRPLLPHDYPSYSAVLASMGSHVQSQLPRSPFPLPAAIPHQFPHPSATASVGTGRTGSQSNPSTHALLSDPHRQTLRSHPMSRDNKDIESRTLLQPPQRRPLSPHGGAERKLVSSPHERRAEHRRSPDIREKRLSSSSTQEGTLRQRLSARPSDIGVESAQLGDSSRRRHSERSPKRLRQSLGHPPPLQQSSSTAPPVTPPQPSHLPPPPPLQPTCPSHPHFPPHFNKGSIIQLANGELKRVEELRTEDFVDSADHSSDLKIDSSTVVRIDQQPEKGTVILGFSVGEHRVQVTVEATVEHPFYVFNRGWSSCQPQRTLQRFGLDCSQLQVGDLCISLTQKHIQPPVVTVPSGAHEATSGVKSTVAAPQVGGHGGGSAGNSRKRRWSAPDQFQSDERDKQDSPTAEKT